MSEIQEEKTEKLFLGVDFGTSCTAIMSDRGFKSITPSMVGYPKDIIGIKFLGKAQVFGEEVIKNRAALTVYRPLEDGVIRDASESDYNAALELLQHVVGEAKKECPEDVETFCILGVPSKASVTNKEQLLEIAQQVVSVAMIVSEPFMVAYQLNKLNNCIIVDIGAGTVDICGIKGSVPAPQDQITTVKGGDYIDERLESAIKQKYFDVQITRNLVRTIKEEHSFVGEATAPLLVTLRSEGKPATYDITSEMRVVCECIVPDIVENIINIMKGFDPEYQAEVLKNIILAGGGSQIKGLASMIEEKLHEYGEIKVSCVDDTAYTGCAGALKLTQDLPPEHWNKVGFAGSED